MKCHLTVEDLWEVTCNEPSTGHEAEDGDPEADRIQRIKNGIAMNHISSRVKGYHSTLIRKCTSAHSMWTTLHNSHKESAPWREHQLRVKLANVHKKRGQSIQSYIDEVEGIVSQIREGFAEVLDAEAVDFMLDGLPDEYHMLVLVLRHCSKELTMDGVAQSLIQEDAYLKRMRKKSFKKKTGGPTLQL